MPIRDPGRDSSTNLTFDAGPHNPGGPVAAYDWFWSFLGFAVWGISVQMLARLSSPNITMCSEEMDRFFRFSDYDIWAYLSAGMLTIAAWDFAFGTSWVLRADWSPADGTIIVFAAYIVGQISATPASWILERLLVARVLQSPSVNLFAESQTHFRGFLQRTILSDYYSPLDEGLRRRIIERAGPDVATGEPLFWRAYPIAKRDPTAFPRMGMFLNQYGFCRNIAFVAILAATFDLVAIYVVTPAAAATQTADQLWFWAVVSIIGGILMFHRFLKFYRLYAVEVFVAYAETGVEPSAS